MKTIVYAITILIGFASAALAEVEVAFTPSQDCENMIIERIDNARHSIVVAVYSINNVNIVGALERAYNRGIDLKILTDRLQASGKHSKVMDLYKYGINIRVHSKNKIEHNKFAVFDGEAVSTGSYNWTNPASSKNSENCLFLEQGEKAVTEYKNRFEELWMMNTEDKSDRWFVKKG